MFDPSRLTGLFTEISEKAAQALPLRQDAVTLLTYIRDNKVTGTQSTGNLPLKVVADVAAHFVAPPALETQIGETVFRFRTEEDVWPVFFAHVLLQGAGLINGGPGRRWRLAQSGEKFLMAPPVVQSWILFTTWWRQINWLIAYPIGAFGDILPQDFAQSVLEALKELSIDQPTPIEALAERVLKAVAWIWPHQTPETIHSIVYSSVEQMVVDPLEEIGVLTTKRTNDPTRLLNIRKLETFSLTFFGRALLDSI
jgi:hypothetical protein